MPDKLRKDEKEWKKVDDYVQKGLPKSALTEVKKIYALAKKEKQDAQVIKSLVYMTGLQDENREANKVKRIVTNKNCLTKGLFMRIKFLDKVNKLMQA